MKTVLMITYYFPPLGGPGSQRSAKFVKYLPEQGWKPVVLTVVPNRRNCIEQGLDSSLLADIPEDVHVARAHSSECAGLYGLAHFLHLRKIFYELERLVPFLPPYYKLGWLPYAFRAGRRILESTPIDVIYTSAPPHLAHFVGRALGRKYGIPWVADFRSLWTQRNSYRPGALFQTQMDRRLEASVLESADAVIANTSNKKHIMCSGFHVSTTKVHAIPNGYDPADFEGCEQDVQQGNRFIISCIGNFYEMPDTDAFFRSYRRFHDDHPDAYLRLVGPLSRRVRHAAGRLLNQGSWESSERGEHTEVIHMMRQSALLLANVPLMADTYWVPGKLYEYMAAGRPTLFIGAIGGEAACILQHAHGGLTVDNDEAAILSALAKLYEDWHTGHQVRPDVEVVQEYDRRQQARSLAGVFERVCEARQPADSMDRVKVKAG